MNDYDKRYLPGLMPRSANVRGGPDFVDRAQPREYTNIPMYISKGFRGRNVTVGTTPGLLLRAVSAMPFMILNPARSALLTTPALGKAMSTEKGIGNSESSPIDVSGFENAHFFLNISAITGAWDIFLRCIDDMSLNWCDAQKLYAGINRAGTFYAGGGSMGIASQIAFGWSPVVGGVITFSINVTLKNGLGGSSQGIDQYIYLGGPNVTIVEGFPLLEGDMLTFTLGENTEIWAIANTILQARVFEL